MTDLVLQVRATLDDTPVDDLVDVYRDAFTAPGYDETPEDVARFREGLPRHAAWDGFRLALACDLAGGLIGFAYGYTGESGQWWTARRLYERAGWRNLAPIDEDSTLMGIELGG